MDPTTIYGISKQAGERLCEYYFSKYGVDVRSIRYPGIISYKSPPGGGTTDYAIAIFHAACLGESYPCYLGPETTLPMIYMPDAIRATIESVSYTHLDVYKRQLLEGFAGCFYFSWMGL